MCPKCKKDFDTGVKAAYKLGFADGERQLEITINTIKKTHRALFDELLRLDKTQPIDFVDSVQVPLRTMRRIIKHYRKHNYAYMVNQLKTLIKNQHGIEDEAIEKALKAEVTK